MSPAFRRRDFMNPTQIGPYLILDKLGSGGMGSVYLGRHHETGLVAAVKVLPAALAREEGFIERFGREIDAMLRLNNPHIVKLYDSGTDGETYYYSMEYVAGETLMSLIRRERKVSWQKCVEIAMQVCQALKGAHDAGIIHRDLKPSNLLLAQDGTVKLTDFGVAQLFAAQRLTVTGGIVGTAEFMSPEQASGKRATRQSDLYSLGALMYVLITGRPPFGGSTAIEVMHKHKFAQYERPRLLVPDLPVWIEEIIMQLLEKDPEKRIPDALVLYRRLETALRKIALSASPVSASDTEVTLSEGEPVDENSSTVAAVRSAGTSRPFSLPGPATLMQSLMRAEVDSMRAGSRFSQFMNNGFVLVLLLAVTIAGGYLWFRPRELTPDQKFSAGIALLKQPQGSEWLRAKREYFEPLIAADPDRWEEEVTPYLRQIELYELTRPLPLLVRRAKQRDRDAEGSTKKTAGGGAEANAAGTDALSHQTAFFFHRARAYQQMGDPGKAERTLIALQALLGDDPQRDAARELTSQFLARLREEREQEHRRDDLPRGALDRADVLLKSGDVGAARRVWEAILELYRDDPLAAAHVARAREGLAKNGGATVAGGL